MTAQLLSYILQLGLDYRYGKDLEILFIRTEKHSRHGRFYLAGGDELIDTARQLSVCFA